MKRFEPQPEPTDFEQRVRKPGTAWLADHPDGRLPDYWRHARSALADAFGGLCAYSVIHLHGCGTVDHFVPLSERRELAYEWSNYRYCAGWLNSSKQNVPGGELLDPFEVQDDWFEISLPSLQLRVTDACPPEIRARAEYTIRRLQLRDGERAIRGRQALMELYVAGAMSVEALDALCPLLGQAVRRHHQ